MFIFLTVEPWGKRQLTGIPWGKTHKYWAFGIFRGSGSRKKIEKIKFT